MSELLSSVSAESVLIATVIYFALGAVWYSPVLFAKPWMEIKDIPDDHEGGSPLIFGISFLLQLMGVFSLALFIMGLGIEGALNGALIGFLHQQDFYLAFQELSDSYLKCL